MPAAHDIYADQLRDLRRGHPLYHPEPRAEGPVEIGDVGYIKDGAFRRIFNVSKPAGDPVQRFGVPEDFVQFDLGAIDKFDAVLEPGPLHSRTISTVSAEVGTPGEILPAEASFHFNCSSKRGAILILETQMDRTEAIQYRHLEAYITQNCQSWHAFSRNLGFRVGFGDLMFVTECSKAAAWSSAVYSNSTTEFGLSFSVGMPFTTTGVAASRSLEKVGPVERRRSQKRALDAEVPLPKNDTVFIKAYRVGMRQMYYRSLVSLFMKVRGQGSTQGEIPVWRGGDTQQPSIATQNSSHPFSPSMKSANRPFEQDFHASIALLALKLESNADSNFVMIHDEVWCSASPGSKESQIMDEFTDFYFSGAITSYLNSTSGDVPFDIDLPPPQVNDSSTDAMRIRRSGEDSTPNIQSLTSKFGASSLGVRTNPKQREVDVNNHFNISDTSQVVSYSYNEGSQTSSKTLVMTLESSSGPVTPPIQKPLTLTRETQITTWIHPSLELTTNPIFQIDLSDVRTIAQQTSRLSSEGATMPLTASLEVVCGMLPWKITITPRGEKPFVTVSDVLNGLYSALQRQITHTEFTLASPQDQKGITEAYRLRCKRVGSEGGVGEELSKGVKRVDFLLGRNRFLGFSLVEQLSHSQPIWRLSTS